MSYQVLARKWRPKAFAEVIGQQHVLQALINALNNNRLHHAYLFSGTRGVGKTTLARIFAKSLNCDKGITSEPCGTCGPCTAIDEGRFVDLIEVDAASRTKVEDTRELLENVQYAPSQGRYKVYLIDEVHMLSNHSFNALLKTLEEPPEHVKFLLATTDPHKLPVTVLSRCLQLNLMNMTPAHIVTHLDDILSKEQVQFTLESLWQIARAADGSMRDALSLTDQAIAYTDGQLTDALVTAMLGGIDRSQILSILQCLTDRNAAGLLAEIEQLSRFSPDFQHMLTELLTTLHRVAIAQIAPDALGNDFGDRDLILAIASRNTAEDIQLFYQIGILARKDLPYAPDARSGFEMALLRMMVFSPEATEGQLPPMPAPGNGSKTDQADADGTDSAQLGSTKVGTSTTDQMLVSEEMPREGSVQTLPNINVDATSTSVPSNDGDASESSTGQIAPSHTETDNTPVVEAIPQAVAQDATGIDQTNGAATAASDDVQASEVLQSPPWEISSQLAVMAPEVSDSTADPTALSAPQSEVAPQPDFAAPSEGAVTTESMPIAANTPVETAPITLEKDQWASQFWRIGLDGMTESIFGNASWETYESGCLSLLVDQDYEALFSDSHSDKLLLRLQLFDDDIQRVLVRFGVPTQETPFMLRARLKEEQRVAAVAVLKADPFVQQLEHTFGARIDEGSVKPRLH